MRKILIGFLVSACLFGQLFGFATLTAPAGGDAVMFSFNVPGVTVIREGRAIAQVDGTQQVLKLKRERGDVMLTFRKDGYSDQTLILERTTSAMFYMNFLLGGLWGLLSDLGTTGTTSTSIDSSFTGNSKEFSPNQYFVQMVKI